MNAEAERERRWREREEARAARAAKRSSRAAFARLLARTPLSEHKRLREERQAQQRAAYYQRNREHILSRRRKRWRLQHPAPKPPAKPQAKAVRAAKAVLTRRYGRGRWLVYAD